jgi:hypothetical protein
MPITLIEMDDSRDTEFLLAEISRLVGERQHLRAEEAGGELIERNRVEIAEAQRQLSQALIRRYGPASAAAAAA